MGLLCLIEFSQSREQLASSWWALKKVSELELQTPLTVTPNVSIQVRHERIMVACMGRVSYNAAQVGTHMRPVWDESRGGSKNALL